MTRHALLRSFALICAAAALTGCMVSATYSEPPMTHAVPRPAPPPAPVTVNFGFFYNALDPDGDWLWIPPYGWVWAPNTVAPFWRPYTVGRWEWTDWGWTWVSAERWGWATDHYGRWMRVSHHGWVWVPGDVWGPAWVAWRHGPGVVGWAPLPPEVRFHAGVGLDWGGIDINVAIRLDTWCFVDDARFADADVQRYAYPVGRNTTVIHVTRDATRVRVRGGKIFNEGIDRGEIERATRRAVPVRRVVDKPGTEGRITQVESDQIRFFRPDVRPGPPEVVPPRGRKPAEPAGPAADPKVEHEAERRWDRGWNKDWDKLEKLQRRDVPAQPTRPAQPAQPAPPARSATPKPSPAPTPAPPHPESLEKVRDENWAAADNAYRELVAERDRAKRQAQRGPKKPMGKRDEKGEDKKEGKEEKN